MPSILYIDFCEKSSHTASFFSDPALPAEFSKQPDKG